MNRVPLPSMGKIILFFILLATTFFCSCIGIFSPKLSDLIISDADYENVEIGVLSGRGIVGKVKNNFSLAAASNIWVSVEFYVPNYLFDSTPEQEMPLIRNRSALRTSL